MGGTFTTLGENCTKNQQNVQKVDTNDCFTTIKMVSKNYFQTVLRDNMVFTRSACKRSVNPISVGAWVNLPPRRKLH